MALPNRVSGPCFESCNCDAIGPCRMVGGGLAVALTIYFDYASS